METEFVLCPCCGGKTRLKLLPETVLKKYPLFCPKCKKEIIISAEHMKIKIDTELQLKCDKSAF